MLLKINILCFLLFSRELLGKVEQVFLTKELDLQSAAFSVAGNLNLAANLFGDGGLDLDVSLVAYVRLFHGDADRLLL